MADDWDASDRKLHKASVAAIKRFAREHSGQAVCSFFFDCDEPRYGHLSISLDTPENNLRAVKELEGYAVESRAKNLRGKITWEWAKYQLSTPVLSPFNTNSGDFEFPEYAEVEFPAWVKLAEKGDYPNGAEHEDDYLESNARLVMWRVAEQLVAEGAFAPLTLASPFLLGYSIHDQEEVILRILNWPKAAEPHGAAERAGGRR
jgi:hypothetical protein